jgi:hypothetical protein
VNKPGLSELMLFKVFDLTKGARYRVSHNDNFFTRPLRWSYLYGIIIFILHILVLITNLINTYLLLSCDEVQLDRLN